MLCPNYRDIHVKDLTVKDLSAYWRALLKRPMESYSGDFVFGGLHGRGADLMAHVSSQYWAVLHHQRTQLREG